ncbi:MAG: two-component system, NarL family, sensor kinase [Actinomycetota bacterium]
MLQFALIGAVAVAIVALATSTASRRVGQREAISEARTTTILRAQGLVEPVLRDEIAARDPSAIAAVRDVVDQRVIDHALVVVKVWDAKGTVLFATDPRLEGQHFTLAEDDLDALRNGTIQAEVSDLHAPENRYDRRFGKLLEVYLPVRTPNGTRLLFEAYFRYDAVAASGNRIWRSFAPISIGALLVLELLQIPLAWSLALRLRQRQRERESLLRRALEASDVERRRIAADLHDGVVQDLAGVAFSLAAASHEEAAASVRATITSLRAALTDIYPPDVSGHGLRDAIGELAADAGTAGLDVRVDIQALTSSLTDSVGALLFRVVREALRNVITHARATHATVRAGEGRGCAWVEIADDGVGFDRAVLGERAAEGHIGLKGLEGVLHDAGGTMTIDTEPGRGTKIRAEVKLQ